MNLIKAVTLCLAAALLVFYFLYDTFPSTSTPSDDSSLLTTSSSSSSSTTTTTASFENNDNNQTITDFAHTRLREKLKKDKASKKAATADTSLTGSGMDSKRKSESGVSRMRVAPTRYPDLLFPPDDGQPGVDLHLNVREETDLLWQAQSIPEDQRMQRLVEWLTRCGARFDGFEFRTIAPEYRGMFATQDLEPGHEIIYIPDICILNAKFFNTSVIGQLIRQKRGADFVPDDYWKMLVWYVLIERFNPESWWKYWIAILPIKYNTIPIFWNETEMGWLKGSYLFSYLSSQFLEFNENYKQHTTLVPALKVFTLEQFIWANTAVMSRIWGGGGAETSIPLMDMINHMAVRDIHHNWLTDGSSFSILNPVSKGTQLYWSYGDKGQAIWLHHYGFTAPNNEQHDYVYLPIEFNQSDPLFEAKKKAYSGYSSWKCDFTLHYNMNGSSKDCYDLARMRAYEGTDLSRLHLAMGPTSPYEELEALNYLAFVCKQALVGYPATYEEDVQTLKNHPTLMQENFNYYNALVARSAETRILNHYITLHHLFQQLISTIERTLPDGKQWLSQSASSQKWQEWLARSPSSQSRTSADSRKKVISDFRLEKITPLQNVWIEQYFSGVLPALFPETL